MKFQVEEFREYLRRKHPEVNEDAAEPVLEVWFLSLRAFEGSRAEALELRTVEDLGFTGFIGFRGFLGHLGVRICGIFFTVVSCKCCDATSLVSVVDM